MFVVTVVVRPFSDPCKIFAILVSYSTSQVWPFTLRIVVRIKRASTSWHRPYRQVVSEGSSRKDDLKVDLLNGDVLKGKRVAVAHRMRI